MGYFDNIGATLLDVSKGMEYEKENQRRDATFARSEKRADMADELAKYGMEDAKQARGDKAARRAAATGKPSLEAAATAERDAALARGDTAGAGQADAGRLTALKTDFEVGQAQLAKELQPARAGMERAAVAGQVARQPGLEAIAGQQVQDQSMAMREKLLARFYQIAMLDKNEAIKLVSDSPLIFPGKKVIDIMVSNDGQRMAVVGEDGQPLTMLNKPFMEQLSAKYGDPEKLMEVEPGKSVVGIKNGKARELYKAAEKPLVNKYSWGPNGERLNTATNEVTPAVGGGTMPPAKRDARLRIAEDIISKALGGSLNMGLPEEGAQRTYEAAIAKAEQFINSGADPAAAATKALDEIKRAGKTAGIQGNSGPTDFSSLWTGSKAASVPQ